VVVNGWLDECVEGTDFGLYQGTIPALPWRELTQVSAGKKSSLKLPD
jgi:hypothetical protein